MFEYLTFFLFFLFSYRENACPMLWGVVVAFSPNKENRKKRM